MRTTVNVFVRIRGGGLSAFEWSEWASLGVLEGSEEQRFIMQVSQAFQAEGIEK